MKNISDKNKVSLVISLAVILGLGGYYLWKISSYEQTNNIQIEEKQEYVNIWSYNIWEFKEKMWEDYIVIDIRTPWEVAEWYIEWMDLNIDYYKDDFKSKIEKLDKTKKYLIYCHSWNRSWNTLYLMKNLWFTNVHDLTWWIWAWERAGEKVSK
jgi:rhodanese-related sulfurtransferase